MAKKLYLTAKTKLTPTPEQTDLLWQTSDSARRLYNLALEQQQTVFIQRKRRVSHFEQKRELPHVRREYFPELHSQTAQEVIFDLEEAYKSFLSLLRTDKTARPPRFRGRKYFYTLTYPQKATTWKMTRLFCITRKLAQDRLCRRLHRYSQGQSLKAG